MHLGEKATLSFVEQSIKNYLFPALPIQNKLCLSLRQRIPTTYFAKKKLSWVRRPPLLSGPALYVLSSI